MDMWLRCEVTPSTFITLLLCTLSLIQKGSSCNDEQVRECKQSVEHERLSNLAGGGVCTKQQYVHYTHLCTVKDYRDNVDYCCCALDSHVLCCRYHQDWAHFRCSEPEDTVAVISHRTLPLKYLIPAILGPLLLVVCCLACCVRKYYKWLSHKKKQRKGEQETRLTVITNPPSSSMPAAMTPYSHGRQVGAPEAEPLTSGPLLGPVHLDKPSMNTIPERTSLEPSAPPDDQHAGGAPPYTPLAGEGEGYPPLQPYCSPEYSRQGSMASAASGHYGGVNDGRCPSCSAPPCAPPPYEESLQHPVMQH